MKSVSIPLVLLAMAFSVLADAAPVTARYLRFEGYSTTATGLNAGRIRLFEIEAFANGVNVARNAAVTANSVTSGLSFLNDGNLSSGIFSSSNTDPGPPSEASPHWIQMDFGSAVPIERTNVYVVGGDLISFGLFLSNDGVSWTQYGRYNQAGGTIQSDPSAPFVVIQSATMRPGTTLMDIVYRVNDPDDATVKTRALAFVDGVRSFANVIRPVTFVEGTAAKLGDAIPANVDHTLTWDVATDWDVDLGQVKFEVLAIDGRGLLPFDWITIPEAGGKPELTISLNSPTNADVLDALLWRYADGDPALLVENGILRGNSSSGVFEGINLANGSTVNAYGTPFIFKRMDLDPSSEVTYAAITARAGLSNLNGWHCVDRPYAGIPVMVAWGSSVAGPDTIPPGLSDITAITAGYYHNLVLKSDGTVVGWGSNPYGGITIPAGLSDVTAITAGQYHSLALKNDGTVVGWGSNFNGQITIPQGLDGVTAIAAGHQHSLALRSDGTVVGWGRDNYGQASVPAGLSGITAIAAGQDHSLALKSDGTVVGWGRQSFGGITIPAGLTGATAIAAGEHHSLALKIDGSVVGWGYNISGQVTIPAGLSDVTAITACGQNNLALKSDGTVVGWGSNSHGQVSIPEGLSDVTAISIGLNHSISMKAKAP